MNGNDTEDPAWNKPEQVIKYYESHQLYFRNYNAISHKEKLKEVLNVTLHYCNALIIQGYLSRALEVLKDLHNILDQLGISHPDYEKYRADIQFFEGVLAAKQQKYRKGAAIFRSLLEETPDSQVSRSWHAYCKGGLMEQVMNSMFLLGGAIIAVSIILEISIKLHILTSLVLDAAGVGIIALGFITDLIRKKWFRVKE